MNLPDNGDGSLVESSGTALYTLMIKYASMNTDTKFHITNIIHAKR